MSDELNPQENTMTLAPNEPHLSDEQRQQMDLVRGDADMVREIATIAEEQLGETEAERYARAHFEEALHNLAWDLGASWADHITSTDKVLRNGKGDLDEDLLLEFLRRVLGTHRRNGMPVAAQTARQARQEMHKERKLARIGAVRSGVAVRLDGLADSLWGQESAQSHAPSPVHRNELPPAIPASAPPQPEQLPKRVAAPTPAEPMFPKAPPEAPAEQTGVIAARAVESLREAGHATPASDAALASLNQQRGPAMMPPHDPQFGVASIPSQRAVRSGDTARLPVIDGKSDAGIDEALGRLADDAESAESRPFAPAAVGSSPSTAGSRSGSGASDED